MHKGFILIFILLIASFSFCQVPFPGVLFNGKSPRNGTVETCFLPAQIDLRFISPDTVFTIKKGWLVLNQLNRSDTISISANHIRIEKALFGKSVEIFIKEVEVKVNDSLVRIDTTLSSRLLILKSAALTLDELKFINNNSLLIFCNNELVNTKEVLTLKEKNTWAVYKDHYPKFQKFDLTKFRGKKMMGTVTIVGDSGIEAIFKKRIKKRDFVLVRVYDSDLKTILFNNVVFIK